MMRQFIKKIDNIPMTICPKAHPIEQIIGVIALITRLVT